MGAPERRLNCFTMLLTRAGERKSDTNTCELGHPQTVVLRGTP